MLYTLKPTKYVLLRQTKSVLFSTNVHTAVFYIRYTVSFPYPTFPHRTPPPPSAHKPYLQWYYPFPIMQFMYIVHFSSVFADRISMNYTCSVFILAGIFLFVLKGQGTGIVYTF